MKQSSEGTLLLAIFLYTQTKVGNDRVVIRSCNKTTIRPIISHKNLTAFFNHDKVNHITDRLAIGVEKSICKPGGSMGHPMFEQGIT